jgi:hypothetical protein
MTRENTIKQKQTLQRKDTQAQSLLSFGFLRRLI